MHNTRNIVVGDYSPHNFFSHVHYSVSVLEDRQLITETANRVVTAMEGINADLEELVAHGSRVLKAAREATERYPAKEERRLVANFREAEDGLLGLIQVFEGKENSAVCDPQLDGRNEKRVTRAFNQSIMLMKEVFSVTQSIRWALMENVEGIDEIVSSESIDDLIARL